MAPLTPSFDVILNVYELQGQGGMGMFQPILCCCGLYHTGVEIRGVEYSFAGGAGRALIFYTLIKLYFFHFLILY